jgi:hypothetical protein
VALAHINPNVPSEIRRRLQAVAVVIQATQLKLGIADDVVRSARCSGCTLLAIVTHVRFAPTDRFEPGTLEELNEKLRLVLDLRGACPRGAPQLGGRLRRSRSPALSAAAGNLPPDGGEGDRGL